MAGGAGLIAGSNQFDQPKKPLPTTLFGNPSTFTAAANKQASDYDTIMEEYANLAKSYGSNPITTTPLTYSPITPQTANYTKSSDVAGSLAGLSDLATSGGYSGADIQNIRERDISPIRSVYANAKENINRQKALSGGYSPNYGAVTAKLAREEADQIGDITTKANAGIAQNVASNRLAAAPTYASASASENAARTAADQRNAEIINQINSENEARKTQINQFNTNAKLEAEKTNRQGAFGAIEGQRSLYGTTPALTSTFGNQVVQASQLGQGQQDINNRRLATYGNLARAGAS